MALRGDVVAETTSVLLTKHLWTGPHHCGDLVPFRTIKQTFADFSNQPGSQRFWNLHKHGAFSILRKSLGLRPSDHCCHHETWLYLDLIDWSNTWSEQGAYEPRIPLKIRLAECSHGNPKKRIIEVMSDHSLSSLNA